MAVSDKRIKEMLNGQHGGFAARLAEAYLVADSGNRQVLEGAFPRQLPPEEQQFSVVLLLTVRDGVTAGAVEDAFHLDLTATALCTRLNLKELVVRKVEEV